MYGWRARLGHIAPAILDTSSEEMRKLLPEGVLHVGLTISEPIQTLGAEQAASAFSRMVDAGKRLAAETDPDVHAEIQDTLNRRQTQLSNLQKLDNTMDRADLQLENTLTALGTVYSQVLLIDAGDVSSSKTQRLRENILEQVNSLQDVISSMDEVYNAQDPVAVAAKNLSAK